MTSEIEKPQAGARPTSSAKAAGEDYRPGASFADDNKILREELGRVSTERDALATVIKEMASQFEIQRHQWEQREQQWTKERDFFSTQIDSLKNLVKDLGLQLKTSLGITPKTETGSSLLNGNHTSGGSGDGGGDDGDGPGESDEQKPTGPSEQEKRYLAVIKRKKIVPADAVLPKDMTLQQWWIKNDSDGALIPPNAQIFASHLFGLIPKDLDLRFSAEERISMFGREKGLKSKKVSSTVYDLAFSMVKIKCYQECLTDFASGLTYRPVKRLGPEGSQISWNAMATLSVMVAEYAIPMERIAKMIGDSYFDSSNISRWFQSSALRLVSVYIALGDAVKTSNYFKIDDTSSRVLGMRAEARRGLVPDRQMDGEAWDTYLETLAHQSGGELLRPVIEAFGRVSQKATKEVAKKGINTTLICARIDAEDYRSTVYFYRTHFGQAGNLISRILEVRAATQTLIVIQGDLSSQNHLEDAVAKKLNVVYAGCGSHARRDFFRYRDDDKELCFYILRCFAVLAHVERRIKQGPLTSERILKLRAKFSLKVWELMKALCSCIVEDKKHATIKHHVWKKKSRLHKACNYVINHYASLTYYLTNPLVDADNNNIEQGLRGEKLIENSAYFRKSEAGRTALDIHRTFIASCNAAGITYGQYLEFVGMINEDDIKTNPRLYFPHVVAAELRSRDPPQTHTQ